MRHHILSLVLGLLITIVGIPVDSVAAEMEKGRSVGELRFLTAGTVPDPFITSHFRSGTGLGLATDVDLPFVIIEDVEGLPDTLLSINGNLLIAAIAFEYQYALSNRVALRVGGTSLNRVGTGLEAFIAQGLSAIMNFNAGTTVALLRSDSFQLSGLADLGYANSLAIDVTTFIKDVAEGDLENSSVVKSDAGLVGGVGLTGAWAANRWMGLTAYGIVSGTDAVADRKIGQWALGGMWFMDWGQKGGAPIGLALQGGVANTSKDGRDGGTSGTAVLGVHYTGREDLDLSLEIGQGWIPREDPQLTLNTTLIEISIRYFF